MKSKQFADKIVDNNKQFSFLNTNVITLNLLFSGKVRGGILKGGINMFSAPSAQGKSLVGLSVLKSALDDNMECLVIDSEKSFNFENAKSFGIDINSDNLTVVQETDIVKIKQLIMQALDGMTRQEQENVYILIDSWGPLITHVITNKAIDGAETQDMSLSRWKNELANVMKSTDATYLVINHVYDIIGGFGDALAIPGGKRLYFNSDAVVLGTSKAKEKSLETSEITGAILTAEANKGRRAKEKSRLKYKINHDGGLDMFYGLLDDALAHGCVQKPTNGFYTRPCVEGDKKRRESQIYNSAFWIPIFKNTDFEAYLNSKYSYDGKIMDISKGSLSDVLSSNPESELTDGDE